MDANRLPAHLCSRCGAITEPAPLGPGGQGEGACADCGLGYSTVVSAVFTQTADGPLRRRTAERRRRRSVDGHRARQEEILRQRPFPIHGLDDRWNESRWPSGWGSSNDEIDHIGLGHGDPYDDTAPLFRIDTWRLSGPMAAMTVVNAAQGLAGYLWHDGGAPHELVRPAWTSDDPTETWSALDVPVDEAPVSFRALTSGPFWVALSQTETTLLTIEARHIEPGAVGVVTVDDVDPYLGDGPSPH